MGLYVCSVMDCFGVTLGVLLCALCLVKSWDRLQYGTLQPFLVTQIRESSLKGCVMMADAALLPQLPNMLAYAKKEFCCTVRLYMCNDK